MKKDRATGRDVTVGQLRDALDELTAMGLHWIEELRPLPADTAAQIREAGYAQKVAQLEAELEEAGEEAGETQRELDTVKGELRKAQQDLEAERRTVHKLRGDLELERKRSASWESARTAARREVLQEVLRRNGTWAPGFDDMTAEELNDVAAERLDAAASAVVQLGQVVKILRSSASGVTLNPGQPNRLPADPVDVASEIGRALMRFHGGYHRMMHTVDDKADEIRGLTERLDLAQTTIKRLETELTDARELAKISAKTADDLTAKVADLETEREQRESAPGLGGR